MRGVDANDIVDDVLSFTVYTIIIRHIVARGIEMNKHCTCVNMAVVFSPQRLVSILMLRWIKFEIKNSHLKKSE